MIPERKHYMSLMWADGMEEDNEDDKYLHQYHLARRSPLERILLFQRKLLCMIPLLLIIGLACFLSYRMGYDRSHQDGLTGTDIQLKDSHHHDAMPDIRYEAAIATMQIMKNDTQKAAAKSFLVDIGPLADVVDRALDTVGFRRVFLELFETYKFARATMATAKLLGMQEFKIIVAHASGGRPECLYDGIPSDRWPKRTNVCTGCLAALHHWVGAIAADKLLRDGSLLLDTTTGERLYTPRDVIAELQRMAREEEPPDMVTFHSQHGFIWHYVPAVVSNLFEKFPVDLAIEMCGPDLIYEARGNRTYSVIQKLDIVRECRHGLGHAVFYEVSMRQLGRNSTKVNARTQFRARGGFILSDDNLCEAHRMCKQAPGRDTYRQCIFGVKHAYYEVSLGKNMSAHSKDILENVCGFK